LLDENEQRRNTEILAFDFAQARMTTLNLRLSKNQFLDRLLAAGKAAGGQAEALEEVVNALERHGAVQYGRDETIDCAQDGGAIGERAEADCMGSESSQAAAGAQIEVMVIRTVGKTGMCELAAGGSIGFGGGAKFMCHRFS